MLSDHMSTTLIIIDCTRIEKIERQVTTALIYTIQTIAYIIYIINTSDSSFLVNQDIIDVESKILMLNDKTYTKWLQMIYRNYPSLAD